MAKRKKSISNWALVLIALLMFGISGTATYMYMNRTGGRGTRPVVKARPPAPPVVTVTENTRKVTVYATEASSRSVYLKPVTRTTQSKGDILDAAMEALLASKEKSDSGGLIPQGTRLLSPIKVSHGVATVNLSKEFGSFSGGSTQEALTLNAIAQTLVKNGEGKVKSVLILIEGEPVDSLGGDSDLTKPITPSSAMLKPGN